MMSNHVFMLLHYIYKHVYNIFVCRLRAVYTDQASVLFTPCLLIQSVSNLIVTLFLSLDLRALCVIETRLLKVSL